MTTETKNEINRGFVKQLRDGLSKHSKFIQVVIGPRQVGKTTGIKQLLKSDIGPCHYVSADGDLQKHNSWILEKWLEARNVSTRCLLVIDEVQKVENWAEAVKKLWDEQSSKKERIKLVLLGSSSLQLQQGLSESLAGRFITYPVFHWTFAESKESHKLNLHEYLKYGGYPSGYSFIANKVEWLNYIQTSIVDAVIGKDILSLARVKSPALFKQCFYLACAYGAQELSYTKLLGQLQDGGNTELVKYYLKLFEHSFLLKQIFKYSNKKVISRSSSPKILPLCPAFYSLTQSADFDNSDFGRALEITVGMLFSQIIGGELFYWREKNLEVDYVFKFGKRLWAVEVKWEKRSKTKALQEFKKQFPSAELLLLTQNNFEDEIQKIKTSVSS